MKIGGFPPQKEVLYAEMYPRLEPDSHRMGTGPALNDLPLRSSQSSRIIQAAAPAQGPVRFQKTYGGSLDERCKYRPSWF